MDEVNGFIDMLKKWMDERLYHSNQPARFDVQKNIEVIVRMLEVVFYTKQITVQNNIKNEIIVFGNRFYFDIALEILLFKLMQDSIQNATIILSASDSDDFATFSIGLPYYVQPEETRTSLQLMIQKLRTQTDAPLQNIEEICLKCIFENNGNFWVNSDPEQGTIFNFTMHQKEGL
jgi:light-regulated signal transduction histidine kinase (bacteriophytochrome)